MPLIRHFVPPSPIGGRLKRISAKLTGIKNIYPGFLSTKLTDIKNIYPGFLSTRLTGIKKPLSGIHPNRGLLITILLCLSFFLWHP